MQWLKRRRVCAEGMRQREEVEERPEWPRAVEEGLAPLASLGKSYEIRDASCKGRDAELASAPTLAL